MPEAAERYRGWEPPAPYMRHDEYADWWRPCIGDCWADASSGLPFLDMKKITRESLKKAEKGSGICRILSGLSLIISMTVWERRKTFNTVTEHKTTGSTKIHIQRFELIRPGQFYFDACYNPSKTAFLKNAEKKGCKILNGLGMSSSRGLLRSNYGPDRRLHWMWCEKN